MSNAAFSAFGGGSSGSSSPGNGILSGLTNSSTLAGLQAGTTAASALGMMAAGNDRAAAYNEAAGDARLEAQGALVQGAGQVAGLRQSFMQTIGQRSAAAGAWGIDVGSGLAKDTRVAIGNRVDAQSGITNLGAQITSDKYTINALNDQLMAKYAKQQAGMGGLGAFLGLGLNLLKIA